MNDVFYFGCLKETGHYLWGVGGRRIHHESHSALPADFPVLLHVLDGGLIPYKGSKPQGQCFLAHINGWTIISFLDNSVDRRPGSHSAFIVRGTVSFQEAISKSYESFPEIFARFGFGLIPPTGENDGVI